MLDESVSDPGFTVLEGFGNSHKLDSRFDDRTLVYVSLSQAQLSDDFEVTRSLSSPCVP